MGSMQALSMEAKFNWEAQEVGYFLMVMAITTILVSFFVTASVNEIIGVKHTILIGAFSTGIFTAANGAVEDPRLFCAFRALSNVGMGLRMASMGTINAKISTTANRGRVFALINMFQMLGSLVGPVIGGYIEVKETMWIVAGSLCILSGVLMLPVGLAEKRDNKFQ